MARFKNSRYDNYEDYVKEAWEYVENYPDEEFAEYQLAEYGEVDKPIPPDVIARAKAFHETLYQCKGLTENNLRFSIYPVDNEDVDFMLHSRHDSLNLTNTSAYANVSSDEIIIGAFRDKDWVKGYERKHFIYAVDELQNFVDWILDGKN